MNISELWQQILAAPDNANLKDRYLAALDAACDGRAEMFHLAAEVDRLGYGVVMGRSSDLSLRYESLLADWRVDFDAQASTWPAEIKYVQGWPIELTIKACDFVAHAAEIVATVPLRHLNLKAVNESPEVFNIVQFSQIASLDGSHQRWSHETITALADSLQLRSLRWLDLSYTKITNAEVEILAASLRLRDLEHVDLSNNPCRNPVDAHRGFGREWETGAIIAESIGVPKFGRELEARYGTIKWLHALDKYRESHPPSRYYF